MINPTNEKHPTARYAFHLHRVTKDAAQSLAASLLLVCSACASHDSVAEHTSPSRMNDAGGIATMTGAMMVAADASMRDRNSNAAAAIGMGARAVDAGGANADSDGLDAGTASTNGSSSTDAAAAGTAGFGVGAMGGSGNTITTAQAGAGMLGVGGVGGAGWLSSDMPCATDADCERTLYNPICDTQRGRCSECRTSDQETTLAQRVSACILARQVPCNYDIGCAAMGCIFSCDGT